MTKKELLDILKEEVENEFTIAKLKKKVNEILQQDRYEYIPDKEPFINLYGNISYDCSGYVRLNNELEINIDNTLEIEFDNIYTGETRPSFISNFGWDYPSFLTQLKEYWEKIKYDIYNNFVEKNKEEIETLFNVMDWEYVFDELDNTDLGDYISCYSDDFIEKFIDQPLKIY